MAESMYILSYFINKYEIKVPIYTGQESQEQIPDFLNRLFNHKATRIYFL